MVWIGDREFGFLWVCWLLWVLVCVFGSRFVLGWSVLLMGLWVLLVVGGSGFVGLWVLLVVGGSGFVDFVDAVALLVVDGFGRWLVVTGFLWVC